MAVSLPPWLQIDPIAPARMRQQAIAQQNAARLQREEMQFRREQAAAREEAQARSEERRDRVFQQTQDRELALAAMRMQMQREAEAGRAARFEKNLRIKQGEAEREAKTAAQQMQGMRAVQEGLKAGRPLQELIAENAPLIFAKNPERIPTALPKSVTAPADFTARQIRDESGQPTGILAIPGASGSVKPLPRRELSPEGLLRADQMRLGVISRQLEEADPSSPEFGRLTQARDAIMNRLEQITSRRGSAALPSGAPTPGAPSAAPAPSSFIPSSTTASPVTGPAEEDTITIRSLKNNKVRQVPRDAWESATEEERADFELVSPDEEEE